MSLFLLAVVAGALRVATVRAAGGLLGSGLFAVATGALLTTCTIFAAGSFGSGLFAVATGALLGAAVFAAGRFIGGLFAVVVTGALFGAAVPAAGSVRALALPRFFAGGSAFVIMVACAGATAGDQLGRVRRDCEE